MVLFSCYYNIPYFLIVDVVVGDLDGVGKYWIFEKIRYLIHKN